MAQPLWIDPDLPGVRHLDCTSRGIRLTRSGERLHTVHTFESKGYGWSAWDGAQYLRRIGAETTFVVNVVDGELVQMLPMNVGARTLKAGSVTTNAFGTVHAQTEFIGDAARPFTGDITPAGRRVLGYLCDILRAHGVPEVWAGGVRPPAYPGAGVRRFLPRSGVSGWTGHAMWRGNDHGDPGRIGDVWTYATRSTPTPAPSPGKLDSMGRYRVVPGDTLSEVAARFRTSVDALVLLNGISDPDRIDVGQLLYTRWVVGRGDTLSEIAAASGTSVARLVSLNGIRNPDRIDVGQLLRLP